jgi:hypothetical protein
VDALVGHSFDDTRPGGRVAAEPRIEATAGRVAAKPRVETPAIYYVRLVPFRAPLALAALVALTLTGCTAAPDEEPSSWFTPGAVAAASPTAVAPAPAATVAPQPAGPAAAAAAPPATLDYVSTVSKRWGGCFSRLGIGDIYYDSERGVVTAAWRNGVIAWAVSEGDPAGSAADDASAAALAGC